MNPLRKAVDDVMHYQFTNTRTAMHALQVLIDEADAAADEIDKLRAAVDAAVAEERERCASLCEAHAGMRGTGAWTVLTSAADRIRDPERAKRDAAPDSGA
jgi:ElaB/YqjD/DUF883 family membrane-anchored ribosome-binding protein